MEENAASSTVLTARKRQDKEACQYCRHTADSFGSLLVFWRTDKLQSCSDSLTSLLKNPTAVKILAII